MHLFLYVDRASPVHRLHPVTKLLALPALFFVAFRFVQFPTLVLLAVVVLAIAAWGRVLHALRSMAGLLGTLMLATTAMWLVFDPERGMLKGGFSAEALSRAAALGLRLALMVGTGIVFLATTRVEELAYALRAVGLPYRVAFALTLAFRLVPTFVTSGRAVAEAQRARGLDLDHGSLASRMRRHAPLVVPMLLTSIRRADRLAAALETRGFGSDSPRTDLVRHRFGWGDLIVALALGGAVVAATLLSEVELWDCIRRAL